MKERMGDDDLHAYLDGEMDDRGRAAMESWLADHPEDAERLRHWQEQKDGLHRLFDPVMDEPLPWALHPTVLRAGLRRQRGRMALRAAAACLLLVVGGCGGWWLHGHTRPMVAVGNEALAAHLVYVVEQRRPVEVPGSEREQMGIWLSKRLGARMDIPDLTASGFQLVGGRLLPAANGAAALYMYENAGGQRLTLYVRRTTEGGSSDDLRFQGRDGALAGVWSQGPFGCALSGPLPREDLEPLARQVWRQMGTERQS
ncbi:MAG: transmembrane transcriptional [Rhodospirillaceae bacterium]|nr:MAG: transmembrane transcriptional [Rhodospirillaceae bacterium]TNC96925.1 MAG: transmembrane transcriptional regulator [Stygiobacter sp.]